MSIIEDAMRNLINLNKYDIESLIDYTARFKSAKDILVAQIGGPIKLTKYVSNMKTTTGSVVTTPERRIDAFERLMTFFILRMQIDPSMEL